MSVALNHFADTLGLPPIARIHQRGHHRRTASFTLELVDGRHIQLGDVDGLWVQERFARTITVALSVVPRALPPSEWRALRRVAATAIEVTGWEGARVS